MTTLDELLADTATVDDLPPAAATAGHAVLGAAIAMEAADDRAPLLGARGIHRRRASTVVLIAAGAAAVIITPLITVAGSRPSARADAATVLYQVARAAGAQEGGWPSASYWYSVSTYVRDGQTYRREIWIGHHDPSVLRDPGVAPDLIPLGPGEFPAGETSLTWDELYALPTDPSQLETTLRADIQGAGNSDDSELFVMVGDLLRESPASPALRMALYDVAAAIPGVQVTGHVTDPLGRSGTGIERDGQVYVIDTTTGEILDEAVNGFRSTYLTQGPTDTAPTSTAS